MHQFFFVIEEKVHAGNILFIGKECVGDIKTGYFTLLFPGTEIGIKCREFVEAAALRDVLIGHLRADLRLELLGLDVAGPGLEHLVEHLQGLQDEALFVKMERALQLLVGVLLARLRLDLGDALGQARILRIEDERGVPLVEGLAQAVLAVRLLAPIVVLLRHLHAGLLQPIARLQVAWRELGDLLPALGRLDEASLTVERHALLETVLQHPALGSMARIFRVSSLAASYWP